ncbi:hypothetical protein FRB94_005003 [Tulasnella sp. JGI-2019a]|nr:hypothetical protein FRB94_005003 [Tulasnella sp. JGI-2019a]
MLSYQAQQRHYPYHQQQQQVYGTRSSDRGDQRHQPQRLASQQSHRLALGQSQTEIERSSSPMSIDLSSYASHDDTAGIRRSNAGPENYAAIDEHDLHATPDTLWNDTPKTLYKTSPGTEVGDWDHAVGDSDDEDALVKSSWHAWPVEPALTSAFIPSFRGYAVDKSMLGEINGPLRHPVQTFAMQLNEDIRNAALFPSSPSPATPVLPTPAPLVTSASSPQHTQPQPDRASDVTPQTSSPVQPVVRRPSLHLRPPLQPIDPFSRPSVPQHKSDPVVIAAPMLLQSVMRQPLMSELTISPKDLVLPNAKFEFGFDPDMMVAGLEAGLSEKVGDEAVFDIIEEARQSPDPETALEVDLEETKPQIIESSPIQPAAVRSSRKRPLSEEQEENPVRGRPSGVRKARMEDDDDDEDYEEQRTIRRQLPTKRARLNPRGTSETSAGGLNPLPSPLASASSATQRANNKQRNRHLQPNLVRNNQCMHGCPLVFSTAYEARRHQEDAHGREEAHKLLEAIEASQTLIYPRDYRFLLQIAIHSGEKWDASTKTAMRRAQEAENRPLSAELIDPLIEFATWWCTRYQCPGCGLGFSRLDSKKRHFEKGCSNR